MAAWVVSAPTMPAATAQLPTQQRLALVVVAALCIASSGLLVKASQVDGDVCYSKFSVTLLSEALKLAISSALWLREVRHRQQAGAIAGPPSPSLSARDAMLFTMPALLYVVVNNIRYPILERINPAVYSVVWNLKVIGVAGLLACVLRRPISKRQWGGVLLLIVGSSLAEASQWGPAAPEACESAPLERRTCGRVVEAAAGGPCGAEAGSRQLEGLVLLAVGLGAVSVANVLTEYLYKRTGAVPLHKQNLVLYTYGVCFNGLAFLLVSPSAAAAAGAADGFLHDYTGWTWLVVASQGVSGYLVGALFKYIDAIAAIYADLAAMLATAVLSALFFELDVNPLFMLGFVLSVLSLWIYYGDNQAEGAPDSKSQPVPMQRMKQQTEGLNAIGRPRRDLRCRGVLVAYSVCFNRGGCQSLAEGTIVQGAGWQRGRARAGARGAALCRRGREHQRGGGRGPHSCGCGRGR